MSTVTFHGDYGEVTTSETPYGEVVLWPQDVDAAGGTITVDAPKYASLDASGTFTVNLDVPEEGIWLIDERVEGLRRQWWLTVPAEDADLNIPNLYPGDGIAISTDDGTGSYIPVPGEEGPQGPQGPQGVPGAPGAPGATGDSAYEVWLGEGNEGTEQEFLDSLEGPPGISGNALLEAAWNFNDTNFVGPPAVGGVRFNAANLTEATEMYLSEIDKSGTDRHIEMDLAAASPGATLYVRDLNGSSTVFTVPDPGTDHGTWRTTPLLGGTGADTLRSSVWLTIIAPARGTVSPVAFYFPNVDATGLRNPAWIAPTEVTLGSVAACLDGGSGVTIQIRVDGTVVGTLTGIGTTVAHTDLSTTVSAWSKVQIGITNLGLGASGLSVTLGSETAP